MTASRASLLAAAGTFLALLPLYVLASAGRIDIVDGQIRYEVARSWLESGHPAVRDRRLIPLWLVIKTERAAYGGYNAGASVAGMPAMLLSRLLPGHQAERDRFAFAMTGPVFGAAGMALLVLGYGMLGVPAGRAVGCALVVAVATLWWPASETVFDQNQHAVFLLAALVLAWASGRKQRCWPAALGGVAGACLVNYQENYALLLPLIGLAVFASRDEGAAPVAPGLGRALDRPGIARYLVFGTVSAAGLLPLLAFNYLRFAAPFYEGRLEHPLMFAAANPLAGVLSLVASPGKSAFLFSPPLLLALLGARSLLRRAPALAVAIAAASITHVMIVAQLAFFGGDWCWGPRYLLVLVPLWALALPFAMARLRRAVVVLVVAAGILVQIAAVTLDHHRFFFEHNLAPTFWAEDAWFYFHNSQLAARLLEIAATVREGMPREAVAFSPSPSGEATYAPFGPPAPRMGADWIRRFKVFYLPRPWPFWVREVAAEQRPVVGTPLLVLAALSLGVGVLLLRRAVREAPMPPATGPAPILPAPRASTVVDRAAGRGGRIAAAAGCVALLAIPFVVVEFPPVADLPQHLGQVRLFGEALADPAGVYRIQWLTPYGLSYALLGAAWVALPPDKAGRAGMILLALLWTAAAHVLAARAGRPVAAAVLASMLFFNHTVYWGFYSFAFGWPVFAAWLLLTSRRLHAPARWTDGLLYFAGAAALYLSHALWFATGLAWLVLASAVLRAPLAPTLVRLAGVSPVVVVAAIWYPRLAAAGFDSPTRWFYTPSSRLSGRIVDEVLGGLRGPTEWTLIAVLVAWVAAGLWQHRADLDRSVNQPMALAAALLATWVFFLPDQYSNTIFFASRWAPPAAVLLLLAVPAPTLRPALRLAGAALVAVAFVGATAASWIQLEAIEYSGLRAALTALPPRARVLGLDFVKESEIVKGRPFLQSFAYAQVYRGADLNFSFAEFAPSPVVFRQPRRPPWTRGLEWYPERAQPRDLAFFDYVLVNADPAQHARTPSIGPGLTPATESGRWRLYRVARAR